MKRPLWLLLAAADDPAAPFAAATLGWLAADVGVLFEAYLESAREGSLFAETGSTVLGGGHHGQFNALCARFGVTVFQLGRPQVFASSVTAFGLPVAAQAADVEELYAQAFACADVPLPDLRLTGPAELAPYLYPEIVHRRALGFPGRGEPIEAASPLDIARRYAADAAGVAFGDRTAILAQLPRLIREKRVAVHAPRKELPAAEVRFSPYTEETSAAAAEAAELALATGNPVMVGRQTGDGDLFAWSRRGIALQITEPNRPPFPVMAAEPHRWAADAAPPEEFTDDELHQLAAEGRVLASLVWHSGEVAHNEAMLNLLDLAGATGLKMGVSVHAERYLTCPQQWELIAVDRDRGGLRGLIEPLLHSGGRGVLAEYECPPQALYEHCAAAMETIHDVAGWAPRGYYAFCDTDLTTMAPARTETYQALERAGLDYVISSASPGRNAVLHAGERLLVLNQSPRSIAQASPFVRITTVEELQENVSHTAPGWVLATMDAPVIAFGPYIWRSGSRFMRIADWFSDTQRRINVLPSTVARYARILRAEGYLRSPVPADSAAGQRTARRA